MSNFMQIVGHENVVSHLQTAIKQNKVSHAYIVNGEKGAGKRLIADAFAKTLQCGSRIETQKGYDACNVCRSCMQADTGNHPDIHYVIHQKASIGVDDIREQVNNDMLIKPYSSDYKIYIIEDADNMTEQAQNALLKTIEEPPEYGIIVLLTENSSRLLQTIVSRCVRLDLKPVNSILIKQLLMEQYKIPDYMAQLCADFSQGNIGKAIRYGTSDEFAKRKEEVLHLLKHVEHMTTQEIMDYIKRMAEIKLEINDYLDLMTLWYRDVLMLKVTNDPNTLLYKEEYKYISKQASVKTYEGIENIIKAMDKAKKRLNANVNFDTAMELMLLTLKEN